MSQNKCCLLGLHHYEAYKEVEVNTTNKDGDTVSAGINIVSRCANCGKLKITFVATNADFLDDSIGIMVEHK